MIRAALVALALIAAPALAQETPPAEIYVIDVEPEGVLEYLGRPIAQDALVGELRALAAAGYEGRFYVRAESDTPYRDVLAAFDLLYSNGFTAISVIEIAPAPAEED